MRHVVRVLWQPRATMAEVTRRPAFIMTWIVLLLVSTLCGGWLLSTTIGQQALVDERVQMVEAVGGRVDDAAYARLQANPPLLAYVTSGGRLMLTPVITALVAAGLMGLTAFDGHGVRYRVALAATVHASVVLAVQQIVATPIHYVRESLTSATTLAWLLPGLEQGTWLARLLGSVDVFGLWWVWLLAVGLTAATGHPVRRYVWRLLVVYVAIAAVVATVFAVMGSKGI